MEKKQNKTGHRQGNRQDLNKAEVKTQKKKKAAEVGLEAGTKNTALCKRHNDNGSIFYFGLLFMALMVMISFLLYHLLSGCSFLDVFRH